MCDFFWDFFLLGERMGLTNTRTYLETKEGLCGPRLVKPTVNTWKTDAKTNGAQNTPSPKNATRSSNCGIVRSTFPTLDYRVLAVSQPIQLVLQQYIVTYISTFCLTNKQSYPILRDTDHAGTTATCHGVVGFKQRLSPRLPLRLVAWQQHETTPSPETGGPGARCPSTFPISPCRRTLPGCCGTTSLLAKASTPRIRRVDGIWGTKHQRIYDRRHHFFLLAPARSLFLHHRRSRA